MTCPCCDKLLKNSGYACYWNGRRVCYRCYEELEAINNYKQAPLMPALAGVIRSFFKWSGK